MKRLSQHIEYLLHTRRVLTLPGVGSLHIMTRPAEFDQENSIFFPPTQTVVFNPGDFNDDGVLFNSYLRREGLTYNEAYDLVTDDLDALNELLSSGNPFRIEGIGTLKSTENGFEFINESQGLNDAETIGLNPVHIAGPETEKRRKSAGRKRQFNPDYYYIPIHKKFARVAASFLLVALVGLFAIIPMRNATNSTRTAAIVPVETKAVVAAEPEKVVENTASEDLYRNDLSDRFLLIIGSFRTQDEADKFMDRNSAAGHPLELIHGPRLYWVSIASASEKEDLYSIQLSDEFKELGLASWVLDQEKEAKRQKN